METKVCNTCGIAKSLSGFCKSSRYKGGYENKCKECRSDYRKEHLNLSKSRDYNRQWREKNKERRQNINVELKTKTCATCGAERPLNEYRKSSNHKDGYRGTCKKCINILSREMIKRLSDSYVISRLKRAGHSIETITPELIASKKIQLTATREEKISGKKVCKKCNKKKDKKEFYKGTAVCKECIKPVRKSYRNENSDKVYKRQTEWRKKNSDRFNEVQSKRRIKIIKNIGNPYAIQLLKGQGYTKEQIEHIPALIDIKKLEIAKSRLNKILKQKSK